MINFLKKYYKKAPNGKLELLGKDGMEHAAISLFVMLLITTIFIFITSVKIALIASIITWLILRFVWYWIEHKQEQAMWQKAKGKRTKNLWKFWDWSNARKVDMYRSLYADTLIVFIMFIINKVVN